MEYWHFHKKRGKSTYLSVAVFGSLHTCTGTGYRLDVKWAQVSWKYARFPYTYVKCQNAILEKILERRKSMLGSRTRMSSFKNTILRWSHVDRATLWKYARFAYTYAECPKRPLDQFRAISMESVKTYVSVLDIRVREPSILLRCRPIHVKST